MAIDALDVITRCLAGEPSLGAMETVVSLLTCDDGGFPRVCLLSRNQLVIDGDHLVALARSRRTLANIARSSQAVMHLIAENSSITAQLESFDATRTSNGTLVRFTVISIEAERKTAVLEPPRYLVDHAILQDEGASAASLLASIEESK
jgi:hypothetical protein